MDTPQTWAEALNISPEKLSEWNQSAPAGIPLLVHCLSQGLVALDEYLQWAQSHFELAILDPAFFKSFDRGTLEPARKSGAWNSWCYPIANWEEITYVACAEPPSQPPTDGKFVYVLADPKAMAAAWDENPKSEVSDAPMGLDLNAPTTFVLNLDEKLLATAAPDPHPVEVQEKTGLTLAVDLEKTKVKERPAVPPAPPAPAATKPHPAPAAAKSVKPAVTGVMEEVEIKNAFERLHATYSAALVMKVEDNLAKPFQWDPGLKIEGKGEKSSVPLNQPSLFRIVAKTQQPYHGYVIDSPAHREFFRAIGYSDLPGCVTAIPLRNNQELWGLLVAIGDASAQTPQTLENATKIAEKLVQSLQSAGGLKAA